MKFNSHIWDIIAQEYGLPIVYGTLAYLMNRDTIDSVFNDNEFINNANKILSQKISNINDLENMKDNEVAQSLFDYYKSLQKVKNQIYKQGLLFKSGQLGMLSPEIMAENIKKKSEKTKAYKTLAESLGLSPEMVEYIKEDPNMALLLLHSAVNNNSGSVGIGTIENVMRNWLNRALPKGVK